MAFTITNAANTQVLVAATPLSLAAGVYYFKRCKVDSVQRKVLIDSSPTMAGAFAQDFGDMCWPITGGSLLISDTSEQNVKDSFTAYALSIKQQIGLTLSIPNQSAQPFPGTSPFLNCVCTAFELMRRSDGRIVVPNGDGTTFRAYVAMEFVQLSRF